MCRSAVYAFMASLTNLTEIVREVAQGDKPHLRKSTDRKAQIRKAFVQFSKGALKTYSTQPTIKERGEEAHMRSAVQGLPQ